MKKTVLQLLLVVACVSVAFVSCKKDKAASPQELIVGIWNLESSGVDANKNNILEPAEADTPDPAEIARLIFNADGTGVSRFGQAEDSLEEERFGWTLSPDGKTLRVDQGFIFNHIVTQLTQNSLAYYFEENGEHHFEVWKR